jgi:hypothetical protein
MDTHHAQVGKINKVLKTNYSTKPSVLFVKHNNLFPSRHHLYDKKHLNQSGVKIFEKKSLICLLLPQKESQTKHPNFLINSTPKTTLQVPSSFGYHNATFPHPNFPSPSDLSSQQFSSPYLPPINLPPSRLPQSFNFPQPMNRNAQIPSITGIMYLIPPPNPTIRS